MRYKHCCKSDADSECLESFKLGVFVATASQLKAINCSSKKSPSDKFEGGLYLQFYRICTNRARNLCSGLYAAYILQISQYSLHGQDSSFHFLIAILNLSVVCSSFVYVGIISQILESRYLALSER